MSLPVKLTPMLKQYFDMKEKYKGSVLFFRLGDFYEMFGDDAIEVSKLLSLTLTARGKDESKIPMCGVPYHAGRRYIARLTKLGKSVAICEQLTDPNLPGIVERDVVRIITPGTTFDEYILDNKTNNFIASLDVNNENFGFAFADITTGEFNVTEIKGLENLKSELTKIKPAELLITNYLLSDEKLKIFFEKFERLHLTLVEKTNSAEEFLKNHFKIKNLESFGIVNLKEGLNAASMLLTYLKETQKTAIEHVREIKKYTVSDYMILDESTIFNLELLYTMREGKKEGSLIQVIDDTLTSMGGRMLRSWMLKPLINAEKINYRLEGVTEFFENHNLRSDLEILLKDILDIERILGKIGCGSANARDLVGLKESLKKITPIKNLISNLKSQITKDILENLGNFDELVQLLDSALLDEPAAMIKEGGMIKFGFHKELDELKSITSNSKELLQKMQKEEIEKTKIPSLKVRFNKIFGYYIEISKANLKKVPDYYIRRQTLVNAERFITPELKEYEEKILGAEEKIKVIEYRVFQETVEKASAHFAEVQRTAEALAEIDLLASFAELANENNYCRPTVTAAGLPAEALAKAGVINVKAGRHPVIERFNKDRYVPNDLILDHEKNEFILLTGPNMSGKSSFLRQAALISLLAQIGSFVPAESAELGVVDRIFTRVGASDNLTQGVSTFMAEMQEAANILNNATHDSLIILDELGRGTSTYDGVSIAWAIMEHIHNQIGAKTIFATHYHELTDIVGQLARAENYCVAVSEDKDRVVFLHKIVRGATSKSYGIEVAKLAGLPKELVERANDILVELESRKELKLEERAEQVSLFGLNQKLGPFDAPCSESAKGAGLAQGDKQELERIKKELEGIDIEKMTSLEALGKLAEWQKRIIKR